MLTFDLHIIHLIIFAGASQGIVLCLILLFTERLQKTSNRFLALLVFTFSLISIVGILEDIRLKETYLIVEYLPLFWMTLIPPSLYFFIKYLITPEYEFKNFDYLFFLPFLVDLTHQSSKFISYLRGAIYSVEQNEQYYFIMNNIELVAVLFTIFVIIVSIKALKKYEQNLYDNYAEVEDKSLNWLRNTLIFGVLLCSLWLVMTLVDYGDRVNYHYMTYSLWLGLSFMIYWIGYSIIIRQDLLSVSIFAIAEKDKSGPISNELSDKANDHFIKIKSIVEKEELFRDPNLSMTLLASKCQLSNGYLSQIINQKQGQNFFDFINTYRVEDIKRKLRDPKFDHYNLLALAQESGFKSKSTFNAVFKKMTRMTPTQYKNSKA